MSRRKQDPPPAHGGAELVSSGGATGNIGLYRNFRSQVLGNERPVWVYVPPSYETLQRKRYPVLYLQDGQNMFSAESAFGGVEWTADETAESLVRQGRMEEIIMVAVASTSDRIGEYSPVPDPRYGGGRLADYARFLIDELKPFVDNAYRTLPTARATGILGSSMGGLSALCLGWEHPEVFGVVGAISPSLWWADRYVLHRVREIPRKEAQGPSPIWLDIGTHEGEDADRERDLTDAVTDARCLYMSLLEKGYVFGHDLFYQEVAAGHHTEAAWRSRIDLVLMALFGKPTQRGV